MTQATPGNGPNKGLAVDLEHNSESTWAPFDVGCSQFPEEIWPSREQEWLLRGALATHDETTAIWQEWQRMPLSEFSPTSLRLLPLLYTNLLRLGVRGPEMDLFEPLHAEVRNENQNRLWLAAEVLLQLHKAGLDTMLLKGSCVLPGYYRDLGARPMADVDIAVPVQQAKAAEAELTRAGFSPSAPLSEATLRFRHSRNFTNREGYSIDLHWHLFFGSGSCGGDSPFWDAAVPFDLEGTATRVLAPADLLLNLIAHGLRGGAEQRHHWVADAGTLARVALSEIDWLRLLEQTAQRRLAMRMRAGLTYLAERMKVAIPPEILFQLAALPVARMERAEGRRAGALKRVFIDYRRLQSGVSFVRGTLELPSYLCFRVSHVGRF